MKKWLFLFMISIFTAGCSSQEAFVENQPVLAFSTSYINTPVVFGDAVLEDAIVFQDLHFINAADVFLKMGYETAAGEYNTVFQKGKEYIELDIRKQHAIKNDVRVSLQNGLLLDRDQLYISQDLLEELLPVKVVSADEGVRIENLLEDPYGWTKHPLVAHAFGSIKGRPETCSLEAFYYNYQQGYRLFECDFILTADGGLIARHDWSSYLYNKFLQEEPENNDGAPLAMEQIKNMPIFNDLTAVDIRDVLELMSRYSDAYLVTDTKETDEALVRHQFQVIVETAKEVDPTVLDRIIPQFYYEEMYDMIKEIYDFPSYIFTLYMSPMTPEEVRSFAVSNGLKVITMPYERANADYMNLLNGENIKTYVHTLNDINQIKEYLAVGVYGFYSDYVIPSYFLLETES